MYIRNYNLIKILTVIITFNLLLVHFLVPCFVYLNDWSWIYSDNFEFNVILFTSLVILVSFLPYKLFRFKRIETSALEVSASYALVYGLILMGYVIVYILTGGLSYRFLEVEGIHRSILTDFVLMLSPVMLVLSIYTILSNKLFTKLLGLIFIVVLLLSGGRGYLIQLVIVLFFFLRLRKNQRVNSSRLFRFRDIGLFIVLLLLFGYMGIIRDGGNDILFSSILRFSEPYWYVALENSLFEFNQVMFYDILERIFWSISRVNFFNTAGNIDGNTFYLPEMLNIQLMPGVSLPITLVGQGYLLYGHFGVLILLIIGIFISIFGLKLIKKWRILDHKLINIYMIYYISKMFNFHAKSISGLISYLLYETVRDLIILTIIQLFVYLFFISNVSRRLEK